MSDSDEQLEGRLTEVTNLVYEVFNRVEDLERESVHIREELGVPRVCAPVRNYAYSPSRIDPSRSQISTRLDLLEHNVSQLQAHVNNLQALPYQLQDMMERMGVIEQEYSLICFHKAEEKEKFEE